LVYTLGLQVSSLNNIVYMAKKKLPDLQIVELLLVKAGNDWTRTYMAQIRRELNSDGDQIICGEVVIEGWKVWSIGSTEEEVGNNLDSLCDLVLNCFTISSNDMHFKVEKTFICLN